jgi:glycosyltransferase involved in cell wall biosynthesis
MRFCLIGPAGSPIPPTGWGAVESLVWDYYCELKKRHHNVLILNTNEGDMVHSCNLFKPDVVYIMYDDYAYMSQHIECQSIYLMTHFAYITNPQLTTTFHWYYENIFKQAITYHRYITLNALSHDVARVYKEHGFDGKINVISNGASSDVFCFTDTPKFSLRSICIGKIEDRKKQWRYQCLPQLYFAGNYQDSSFDTSSPRYLGEWRKEILYAELTDYANLVLLSDGETDPLVVKEALMAGLGVVVSECASANLDRRKGFVTIIPDAKLDDIEYVQIQVEKNRVFSLKNRKAIREYALANFSWSVVVDKFLDVVNMDKQQK